MLKQYNEIIQTLYIKGLVSKYKGGNKYDHIETEFYGRNCVTHIFNQLKNYQKSLKSTYEDEDWSETNRIKTLDHAYSIFFKEYENIIGHYFRIIYNIIKFIHNSTLPKEEKKYIPT